MRTGAGILWGRKLDHLAQTFNGAPPERIQRAVDALRAPPAGYGPPKLLELAIVASRVTADAARVDPGGLSASELAQRRVESLVLIEDYERDGCPDLAEAERRRVAEWEQRIAFVKGEI